jgi:hypothetical protein
LLRVNGSSGAVSVQYFTGPGSATAGSDYQAVNGTLQWPSGDVGARTFTVPIVDDTATEQTETFFVTLNSPTGGATLGVPATATVSIQGQRPVDAHRPVRRRGQCVATQRRRTVHLLRQLPADSLEPDGERQRRHRDHQPVPRWRRGNVPGMRDGDQLAVEQHDVLRTGRP